MKPRKIPQRTCIGCHKVGPKRELLRIVRTPEGKLIVDPSGKANGRGAYICPQPACLEAAFNSKRLARSLDIDLSEDDLNRVRAELEAVVKNTPA